MLHLNLVNPAYGSRRSDFRKSAVELTSVVDATSECCQTDLRKSVNGRTDVGKRTYVSPFTDLRKSERRPAAP